MEVTPQIYLASVMHKRLFEKVNQFVYRVYYLVLPLPVKETERTHWFGINRRALLSYYDRDHGLEDGSDVAAWARGILADHQCSAPVANILLVTMPRVLGYVFNPVSFYFCLDQEQKLRAVLCEVHNTFGEQHTYVCLREDRSPIGADEWLETGKVFHVSPFLKREGHYAFRFALGADTLGVWIDYFDAHGNKQLMTSMSGKLIPLSKANLRQVFWSHPLVTLKTIALIHWQALCLFSKGIRYIVKPPPMSKRMTTTHLTKM